MLNEQILIAAILTLVFLSGFALLLWALDLLTRTPVVKRWMLRLVDFIEHSVSR